MTMQVAAGATSPGTVGNTDAIRAEIATYRRELPRLLAEGYAQRFVLIKGDQVVGVWDTSDDAYALKVIRNKPASVKDACWEGNGTKHEESFTLTGPSVCNTLFPIYSTVRIEAGAPLAGDILKCNLKPVKLEDYAVAFTPQQTARLFAIFPQGVCDFEKDGVQQHKLDGTWLDYSG